MLFCPSEDWKVGVYIYIASLLRESTKCYLITNLQQDSGFGKLLRF